jgi:CelD/BcsL family acetyltransferase involved in cellulose biosynthesis
MSTLTTETLESEAAVAECTEAWDRLAVSLDRPYSAPAWGLAWWRHLRAPEDELCVLAFREGDELVGIAPMYATSRRGGHAEYRVLGSQHAARLTPLAVAGREREVAVATAAALRTRRPRPALITFADLETDSPWQSLLAEEWPVRGAWTVCRFMTPAPHVTLDAEDFERWLASRSSNFRQQMRRSRAKLEKAGATFRASADLEEAHRDLDTFAALHLERWDRRGGSAVISDGMVAMLRDVASDLHASGRFRIWNIDVEDKTICSLVFLNAGNEVGWWLGGWDEEWANQRPGLVGLVHAVDEAFERGAARFDLGAGSQQYKYRFADAESLLTRTHLIAPGIAPPLRYPGALREKALQVSSRRISWGAKDRARELAVRLERLRGRADTGPA